MAQKLEDVICTKNNMSDSDFKYDQVILSVPAFVPPSEKARMETTPSKSNPLPPSPQKHGRKRTRKQVHMTNNREHEFEFIELSLPLSQISPPKRQAGKDKDDRPLKISKMSTEQLVADLGLSPGAVNIINTEVYDDMPPFHIPRSRVNLTKHFGIQDAGTPFNYGPNDTMDVTNMKTIQQKLDMHDEEPKFTAEEELEIQERAETYVIEIRPEPRYYHYPPETMVFTNGILTPSCPASSQPQPATSSCGVERGGGDARKRRKYGGLNVYITHRGQEAKGIDYYDNSHTLPAGCKLFKPPDKLVEIVACAIHDSPDQLLQVHQVYSALMNKYPYFRFMDRSAISSWRSSVRHALYQKWFRKIRFNNEVIQSRGCYWSLNRDETPKEWRMPGDQRRLAKRPLDRGRQNTWQNSHNATLYDPYIADPPVNHIMYTRVPKHEPPLGMKPVFPSMQNGEPTSRTGDNSDISTTYEQLQRKLDKETLDRLVDAAAQAVNEAKALNQDGIKMEPVGMCGYEDLGIESLDPPPFRTQGATSENSPNTDQVIVTTKVADTVSALPSEKAVGVLKAPRDNMTSLAENAPMYAGPPAHIPAPPWAEDAQRFVGYPTQPPPAHSGYFMIQPGPSHPFMVARHPPPSGQMMQYDPSVFGIDSLFYYTPRCYQSN